jgi:hypothetical protein
MSFKLEDTYMTKPVIKSNVDPWLGPEDRGALAAASKDSGLRLNSIKCKEITNRFGGQSSEVIGEEIIRLLRQEGKTINLRYFLGWLQQSQIEIANDDYSEQANEQLLEPLLADRRMIDLEELFRRFTIMDINAPGDEAFKVRLFLILLYAMNECKPSDLAWGGKRKRSRKKRKLRRKSKKSRKTRKSYRR